MSDSRRCSLMSDWRRMMPVAEHGASSRMRSNAAPSHHLPGSPASPTRSSQRKPRRSRFSRTRSQATGVLIQRHHMCICAFEKMRRLAAGRRAGVQNAHAVSCVERDGCVLRRAVLHGEGAVGVAGQFRHVAAFAKNHRVRQFLNDVASDIGLREHFYESLARDAARIDAQPDRRFDIVRCEDRVDVVRDNRGRSRR